MTKIYLIRHGESLGNRNKIFTGQTDLDLTEIGYRQAEQVGRYFSDKAVDVIYASDLMRAYNTSLPTARLHRLESIKDMDLREIDGGEWEGMQFDEIKKMYPDRYEVFAHDIGNLVCPGGEAIAELAERIFVEFERIAETEAGKTVAIFSHALPIRSLICRYMELPLEEMKNITWVGNASVTLLEAEDGKNFKVTLKGEQSHLADVAIELSDVV